MSITDQIQKVRLEFQSDFQSLSSENGTVDKLRIKYLGRKGLIANLFNQIVKLDTDERPKMGQSLNTLKMEISKQIDGMEPFQDGIFQGDADTDFSLHKSLLRRDFLRRKGDPILRFHR